MAETSGENLRALIRLIPPARALKEELETNRHMELYEGIGDMALQNFKGLLDSVIKLVDDPYPATLAPKLADGAGDKQKVAAVLMALGQLIAYLEAEIGVSVKEEAPREGHHFVVNFSNARIGNLGEGFEKLAEGMARAFGGERGAKIAEMMREAFGRAGKKEEGKKEE